MQLMILLYNNDIVIHNNFVLKINQFLIINLFIYLFFKPLYRIYFVSGFNGNNGISNPAGKCLYINGSYSSIPSHKYI